MLVEIGPEERDELVETLTEWLDEADETERGFYNDKFFDEPETFLRVVDSHMRRTNTLHVLRERLINAA
jgi:hypothetical protein